jgi:hypothetical protein
MIFPVYQFDDFGNFVAEIDSGLEGYIPPNCTHVAPPELSAGQYAIYKFGFDEWEVRSARVEPPVFDAPPPPQKPPRTLTPLEFLGLCETAGGMTDALLVAGHADATLAPLWLKFGYAKEIEKESALTSSGLDALHATGYLPNGKQAVLDAWPTV